jgi:hypothetical protein
MHPGCASVLQRGEKLALGFVLCFGFFVCEMARQSFMSREFFLDRICICICIDQGSYSIRQGIFIPYLSGLMDSVGGVVSLGKRMEEDYHHAGQVGISYGGEKKSKT